MIWFTSDLHLGHAKAVEFTGRPFSDVDAMNEALVDRINARVASDDVLYILGDFSFKITREQAAAWRRRIACRNVRLVPGNHDKDWTQPDAAGTFVVEPLICTVKVDGGRKLILSHYPLMDWPSLSHGSIHLHGHIHASRAYNEWCRAQRLLRYDVGVDANGYEPVSLDHVLAWFKGVEHRPRVRRADWERAVLQGADEPADPGNEKRW